MTNTIWKGLGAAVLAAATATACGGGSSSSSTPSTPTSPTTPPTTGTPTDTATITIGANGSVSPSSVTVTRGGRVTFVNSDSRAHDMASDPHPEHSDCVELNQVGFLTSGQSRTTGNLNTARTCRFHDHNLPNDSGLKGAITIQ
jgi:plastocyanin